MIKSKFTPEQKIQIVLESIGTGINIAGYAASTTSVRRRFMAGNRDLWDLARQARVSQEKRIRSGSRKRERIITRD